MQIQIWMLHLATIFSARPRHLLLLQLFNVLAIRVFSQCLQLLKSMIKELLLFEGYVSLFSRQSNKMVIDMSPKGLILYDNYKGHNQQVKIVKTDFGQVYFKLRSSGKVFTVSQLSEDDGAKIIEEEFANKPNQKFRMQEISPHSGDYIIYTFCGKAVDLCGGSLRNDTPVFQYTFHGDHNQLWKVKSAS